MGLLIKKIGSSRYGLYLHSFMVDEFREYIICACIKHIYISILFYCQLAEDIELYNKYVTNTNNIDIH